MLIRYLLKQLILPPGGLLLLLLLGWWLRRRAPRLARLCFCGGLLGLWIMSLPVTVQWAARALESETPLGLEQWSQLAEQAQVIVVLGGGREPDDGAWGADQPSHHAVERLRYAARLAKASGLPLLLSGGSPYDRPPSEAELGAQMLEQDFGLPVRWREDRSRNTWENAVRSAELLREQGLTRVLLVTTAAHMPRARWCFERNGLAVLAAPVGFLQVPGDRPLGGWLPEAKAVWQNGLLLNEAFGRWLYPLLYR